eukprot:gene18462-20313_t
MKLADQLLSQVKGDSAPCLGLPDLRSDPGTTEPVLSARETAGLQYIGGYVLHKVHDKHRSRKTWKSKESQSTMQVLKQGKFHEDNLAQNKLTNAVSRGGLLGITQNAEKQFFITEVNFRRFQPTSAAMHFNTARAAFEDLSNNLDNVPNSFISEDVLYSIISLYIKVRCFSFARDAIQTFKVNAKTPCLFILSPVY